MPNRRSKEVPGRGFPNNENFEKTVEFLLEDEEVPWELPYTFLGLDEEKSALKGAHSVILPVPYEATTSYGAGSAGGPKAIIESSRYMELYDQELKSNPSSLGIHTLPGLELTRDSTKAALEELQVAYAKILEAIDDRFLVMLGGEHSVSGPAILSQVKQHGRVSVLQLDAHLDLRAEFDGSQYSHACVMSRVRDSVDIVSVGIRGAAQDEVCLVEMNDNITVVWADEMWADDRWINRVMDSLGDPVYITFDVDYFDPSLMPSTGTPEPGGGDWYRTLKLLRSVFRERNVVGCDVVELAPVPGAHAADFLAAKLVYKLIGYHLESKGSLVQ
ncbi:MAG TPA: agmatinase [Gemmatimonadetes bacterium]|jgi:agmatinase|nr:agmatinase [Gemmatimonadota bacterium]